MHHGRLFMALAWGSLGACTSTPLVIVDASTRDQLLEDGNLTVDGSLDDAALDMGTPPDGNLDAALGADASKSISSVRIEPTHLTLVVPPGTSQAIQLHTIVSYSDSSETILTDGPVWTSSAPLVADVSPAGLFTAAGVAAGPVVVVATHGGVSAINEITVLLGTTTFLNGLDHSASAAMAGGFEGPANLAPRWQYPEEGTLFPARLAPPRIQWQGQGNTVFALTIAQDYEVGYTIYTTSLEYQPSAEEWTALGAAYGQPISLRLVGKTTLDASAERHITADLIVYTADAALAGTLYYRQVETNNIQRANAGGAAAPILSLDTSVYNNCHGCHTASRDGSRLGFTYFDSFESTVGLLETWSPDPPTVSNCKPGDISCTHLYSSFMSFNPAGDRAVAVFGGKMWQADVTPGIAGGITDLGSVTQAHVKGCTTEGCAVYGCDQATDPDCLIAADPAWSPDGTRVAYIARGLRADFAFTGADLMIMDYNRNTGAFGQPRLLVARGNTSNTATVSYPSWSPDGKWLAVLIGPTTERYANPAFIHLVDPATGAITRLVQGAPDGYTGFPSFTPFIEGGHYWLTFHSLRGYGHATVLKQIWAMAIDLNVANGIDGSHPAFWVPGQTTTFTNIQAAWTFATCRGRSQACTWTSQCCAGLTCALDAGRGINVCQSIGCVALAEACLADEDCCAAYPAARCRANRDGNLACQITAP